MSKKEKSSKLKEKLDQKEQDIRDKVDNDLKKVKAEDQQVYLLGEAVKELKILNSKI